MPLGVRYDGPPVLALPLETEVFTPENRSDLDRLLQAQDQGTLVIPVDDPDQIMLDAEGRTLFGGYRYTHLALRQVCRMTVYGLAQALYDLSGTRTRHEDAPSSVYNLGAAIHVFNSSMRLRHPLLVGAQLVVDRATNLIEGLVGSAYQRLGNYNLLERAEEGARSGDGGNEFSEAVVCNRTMFLRFRGSEIDIPEGPGIAEALQEGIYYLNSEVGDGSLRLGHLLFRPDGCAAASWMRNGGRIAHQGRNFAARLGRSVGSVNAWRPDSRQLGTQIQLLQQVDLGVHSEAPNRDVRIQSIRRRIRARGWTLLQANRLIRETLVQGSAEDESRLETMRDDIPPRTAYDFFAACTRYGSRLPFTLREQMEYLAHQTLTGRFQPVYIRE